MGSFKNMMAFLVNMFGLVDGELTPQEEHNTLFLLIDDPAEKRGMNNLFLLIVSGHLSYARTRSVKVCQPHFSCELALPSFTVRLEKRINKRTG